MRDYLKETIECLETYSECKGRLESKINFLDTIRRERMKKDRQISISGTAYDELPAKTNKISSKVEQIAIRNIQMEIDIEEEIESLRYYLNRIDVKIEELKSEWKEIIIYKHIEGLTWEYVAKKTGQSESTCRRHEKKAIKALSDKLLGEKSYIDLPLFRYFYIERDEERLEN
ncbi:MAG: hypothetical protein AB9856_14395 [Cellulosilyticaceae bacterium]